MTTSEPMDFTAWKEFEREGWQNTAASYHRYMMSFSAPSVEPLLDAVQVGEGMHVLDLATGPGYVAAAAAQRGALAIGIDFSPAMVALARQLYPTVDFREGDAEALSFPDESFDAVVTNYGMHHFFRPECALGEACRVLRHGGRIGFAVSAKPEENVVSILMRAIEAHGTLNVPVPPGPPSFRFSDPEECRRALLEAGFEMPHITQVAQVWQLPSPEALFDAFFEGTARSGSLLRAQSREALDRIRRAVREAASAYEREGMVALPAPAMVVAVQMNDLTISQREEKATMSTHAKANWRIAGEKFASCNCAWGCPCQFNALPTHGSCDGFGSYEIREGYFGNTQLEGVRFAFAISFPGAMHEGNGTLQVIIDGQATPEQRAALMALWSGTQGGTWFEIIAAVCPHRLEPIFAPITLQIDRERRRALLSIPGVGESRAEPIKNPVTGEEHRARIVLPNGFDFKEAEVANAVSLRVQSENLAFQHTNCYAQLSEFNWSNA